jgi:hypothetical protein
MTREEFVKKYKGAVPDSEGRTPWKAWKHLEDEMMHDLTLIVPDDENERMKQCMEKAAENQFCNERPDNTNPSKQYLFSADELAEFVKFCVNLNGVIHWIKFDRQERKTYPPCYDRYLICRKDGKVHWEIWNNSGWAYNGNVIVYYAKIVQPVI